MAELSSNGICNTCNRPIADPYRAYDPRTCKIVAGCVSAAHTGQLVGLSASGQWHNRKEARALRAATARHYRQLGLGVKVKHARMGGN